MNASIIPKLIVKIWCTWIDYKYMLQEPTQYGHLVWDTHRCKFTRSTDQILISTFSQSIMKGI